MYFVSSIYIYIYNIVSEIAYRHELANFYIYSKIVID